MGRPSRLSQNSNDKSSSKSSDRFFNGIINIIIRIYEISTFAFRTDFYRKKENWWLYLSALAFCYVTLVKGNYGYFMEFLSLSLIRPVVVAIASKFTYVQLLIIVAGFTGLSFVILAGLPDYLIHRKYQKAIDQLDLKSGLGIRPKLLKIKEVDENRTMLKLMSVGVGEDRYKARMDDLRASVGQRIESINYAAKNNQQMEIYLAKRLLPSKVHFSDLMVHAKEPYSFVVGQSMAGVVTANLETTPHFMVAGATDGGKSVTFKSILLGLLESSEKIQLYLMDFKLTELNDFRALPNAVVINDFHEAQICLEKLVAEMERRYKLLADKGHNKIDPNRDKLDRIFIGIDECSDLGRVKRNEPNYVVFEKIRNSLDELARKARASGIHLCFATQKIDRASLDTRVQENIQGRIALRMDTMENSVRVLQNGSACGLPAIPGRGIWKKGADYVEVQTPFHTEEELKERIKRLVDERKFNKVKMVSFEGQQDSVDDGEHFKNKAHSPS